MTIPDKAASMKPGTGVIWWNGEPVCYEAITSKHVELAIEARILGQPALLENTPELLAAIEQDLARCAGSPVA